MELQTALDWAAERSNAVLITIRRDGRPQSSDISYRLVDGVFEISITDGRAKTANLRRDPRAVLHLTDRSAWSYLSFDGTVELSATTTATDDATADALVDYYRAVAGKDHPDWDEYRQAMADPDRFEVHNHFISEAELAALFSRAAVVVLPYREATQSAVVVLAYTFGKPVVATNVGGLADQVDHLSSSSASFGLAAFDKWAKMLTASSAKAWPTVFGDGRSLLGALVSTVEAIDEVGLLGGNLRDLYARFCREAGPVIGADLDGPGDAYQRASEAWAGVVEVVGRVETVGAVVDADRRRRQAVTRGDAGSADARAAAEASEDLLAADETGLDPGARADLFAEMSDAIGNAAAAERDALDELRAAVDPG